MTQPWNATLPNAAEVRLTLQSIIDMSLADMPFAAQVAQFAHDSASVDDLERRLVSVYRLALEAGHPFIPDLVDMLLRWIEEHAPHSSRMGGSSTQRG